MNHTIHAIVFFLKENGLKLTLYVLKMSNFILLDYQCPAKFKWIRIVP